MTVAFLAPQKEAKPGPSTAFQDLATPTDSLPLQEHPSSRLPSRSRRGPSLRLLFRSRMDMNQCLVSLPIWERSSCFSSRSMRAASPRLLSRYSRGVRQCPLFSSSRGSTARYTPLSRTGVISRLVYRLKKRPCPHLDFTSGGGEANASSRAGRHDRGFPPAPIGD